MPDALASRVAAGEVVERPASVLKELVENSLDAGAGSIEVEFARGGTALIRVEDDGAGMDRDDALLSLERHATSKLQREDDLFRVCTFGFRGEAVPSIASVSRFRMATRTADEAAGTEVIVHGGKVEAVRDSGRARGTEIEVRSLFYNVPARRKFLRRESTEAAHLQHALQVLGLARPDVGLTAIRDGSLLFRVAPTDSLAVRIRDLFGTGFLERLQALPEIERDGLGLRGFVSRAGQGRPDRSQQFIFLNGRAIQNPIVQGALREALEGILPRGSSPLAVLFLSIDPLEVDCNVHPAKREVRFRQPGKVRDALLGTLAEGLRPRPSAPSPPPPAEPKIETSWSRSLAQPELAPQPTGTGSASRDMPSLPPPDRPEPERESPTPPWPSSAEVPPVAAAPEAAAAPVFEFRGVLANRYLLLEDQEGLVLADVGAVRKRILFERLLRAIRSGHAPSQRLLLPTVIDLPAKDFDWVCAHLDDLAAVGFSIEPFGRETVKVEALPAHLPGADAEELLLQVITHLQEGGRTARARLARESLAAAVARTVSATTGPLSGADVDSLLAELMACDMPYTSPEGRPTLLHYSFNEIARKFGRLPER